MKSLAALVLVFAVSAFAEPPPHVAASGFAFQIPAGFRDQSPGDGTFFTFAVEKTNHLVMQAKVQPGGEPATTAFLDKYARAAEQSVMAHLPGTSFVVVKKELTTVGGVTAARFVFDTRPPGDEAQTMRQLQYYVPRGDQHALITFTAPKDSFDKFVPVFEQAARATTVKK